MKRPFLLSFLLFAFLLNSKSEQTSNFIYSNIPLKSVIGLNKEGKIRIPPPKGFLNKSVSINKTVINVRYTDFPDSAKAAFDYAVSIWETLIHSDVPINIDAYWIKFANNEKTNRLGAASATNYYIGRDEFPKKDVFYVSPLAEKFVGISLNNINSPDIVAYFSNEADWYFGTDGNTTKGRYDFVSVALHELCHGLGFLGSMDVDDGKGIWGHGSQYPVAYDQFLFNANNQALTNIELFPNPSAQLYNELISGNLHFDGPVLRNKTNTFALLYSPSVFGTGSSVDHLSNDYDSTPNELMTQGMLKGSSIHDPGVVAISIMEDIGWTQIHIKHTPVISFENIGNVAVNATLFSDFDSKVINPVVFYAIDGGEMKSIAMNNNGKDSTYTATIPVGNPASVEYYIACSDKYGRNYFYPNTAPKTNINLKVGPDSSAPVISHIPNRELLVGENKIVLLCNVTDLYGIDSVWVEYFVNERELKPLPLIKTNSGAYNVVIDLSNLTLNAGDSIRYRIVAKDKTIKKNTGFNPSVGYHRLKVTQIPEYLSSYETNFETGANEFILDGFNFSIAKGFTDPALQTDHPYKYAGTDKQLNFTAQLGFPIKIAEKNHFISFDEIALVEPGSEGVTFGDQNFLDYVVVEGSKDGGSTWQTFTDGWNSRLHDEWFKAYTQSRYFNNSEFINDLKLYRPHIIDLTSNTFFAIGDVVKIRFRLFSDPFTVGWGWAIDNLKVQTIGLSKEQLTNRSFKVYPNPVEGSFAIGGFTSAIEHLKLFDFTGKLVFQKANVLPNEKVEVPSNLKGLYILTLKGKNLDYKTKLLFL